MIQGHGGNIYALARQLNCDPADIVDMSSNINPLGMPPGLLDDLKAHLDLVGLLPEVDSRAVVENMAGLLDVDPQRLLAGNGTTQYIYSACPALKSKRVLILGPTYADYADACHMHGIEPHYFLLNSSEAFQVDMALLERTVSGFDTVFICNPNNPTAGLIPMDGLHALCRRHPQTRFIIDESYLPFAPALQSVSMAHCGLDNVIVLWSASKIFGLPGLRAGFLIADEGVRAAFERFMQPWSLNSLAQAAINYLGRNQSATRQFIQHTRIYLERERRLFQERLSRYPSLTLFPSVTSYILIELPLSMSAHGLCDALVRRRLLIRNCSNFYGLSDRFVRVALKSSEINALAADLLAGEIAGR
jgi:threonine-phosphate decarboxylase